MLKNLSFELSSLSFATTLLCWLQLLALRLQFPFLPPSLTAGQLGGGCRLLPESVQSLSMCFTFLHVAKAHVNFCFVSLYILRTSTSQHTAYRLLVWVLISCAHSNVFIILWLRLFVPLAFQMLFKTGAVKKQSIRTKLALQGMSLHIKVIWVTEWLIGRSF